MLKINDKKKYLLACSFGPDSMALFNLLLEKNIYFEVAIVNYNLREESKNEFNSLKVFCKEKNIMFHGLEVTYKLKGNIENECRKIRYQFFSEIIKKRSLDFLLVAHNKDDLIETYIMQKRRKNLVNYYGLAKKTTINNMIVLRPLIDTRKDYLQNYCIKKSVPFAIDSSNYSDAYQRNKIRHSIINNLLNKDVDQIVKIIREENRNIQNIKQRICSLDLTSINAIKDLDDITFCYALNELAKKYKPTLFISQRTCLLIKCKLISITGNKNFPINKSTFLQISYGKISINSYSNQSYEFIIDGPTKFECDYFALDFTTDTSNRNITLKDYPLTIRTCKKGDKYRIKDYNVLVRRLFIDWKLPSNMRARWPLICNKEGKIVYIPRFRPDFKITKNINFYVK